MHWVSAFFVLRISLKKDKSEKEEITIDTSIAVAFTVYVHKITTVILTTPIDP